TLRARAAFRGRIERLCQQSFNRFAADIREAIIAALKAVSKPGVINPQTMEHGGVEIVHVDRVRCDVVTESIGGAIDQAGFDATAGHPNAETPRMMVAAEIIFLDLALRIGGAPELTTPNDQCIVEKPALLKVLDQRRAGLIGVF